MYGSFLGGVGSRGLLYQNFHTIYYEKWLSYISLEDICHYHESTRLHDLKYK